MTYAKPACAILVSIFPSFPHYKEVTGGRGQIVPGVPWPHPSIIEFDTCQMRRLKQVAFSENLARIMPPVGSYLKLRSTAIKTSHLIVSHIEFCTHIIIKQLNSTHAKCDVRNRANFIYTGQLYRSVLSCPLWRSSKDHLL